MTSLDELTFRRACAEDRAAILDMHHVSFRTLGARFYTGAEIEGALRIIDTADPAIIGDGTYWLACLGRRIVGTGAWTLRRPNYEDHVAGGRPRTEGRFAVLRAIFVDPDHARRGIARRIVEGLESEAALRAGVDGFELTATLSGVPLYRALGYAEGAPTPLTLPGGGVFRTVRMAKDLRRETLPLAA